jgi:hypothetical protein
MFLDHYNYGGLGVKPSFFLNCFTSESENHYFLIPAAPIKSHRHQFKAVEFA